MLAGGGIVLLVLIFAGANWLLVGRHRVSTDNAYVRADISLISPQVEGYVRAIPAAENQGVHAGDVLVEIDATDYQARVAAARAALAEAEGARTSQQAGRALASADVARYRPLAERGLLSPARMQQLEIQARQAGGSAAASDAAVEAARAQLAQAELDLQRTTIRAPIDGVVGDRQVQLGQFVRTGSPLPPNQVHAGAGLFNTMRNLGGAFGIAALATVQAHSFALHRQELYAAADPQNLHVAGMIAGAQAYLEQAGAADPERQALMRYAALLDREALVMTFNDQFLLLAAVISLSAFAMLLLRPRPNTGVKAPLELDEALAH